MALLDPRGVFERCPSCDTAVSADARTCAACGADLRAAAPARDEAPERRPARPVFGNAAGAIFRSGATGAAGAAIEKSIGAFTQALGEVAVRLLGMKTGEDALDDNPWRRGGAPAKPGVVDLFRRRIFQILFPFRTGLRETALISLFRDLAKYADSGIGFHDALSRMERGTRSPVLRRLLHEVRADIVAGSTLADAFAKHEYLLDPIHIALLEVGESLGTVGENTRIAVEMIEEKREIRRQVLRKLIQPIGLVFIANYVLTIPIIITDGVLSYLGTVIVPTLAFAGLLAFGFVVVPVLAAAAGREIVDRAKIELPAFGTIARTHALARFTRTLGAAIEAGVEIQKSLTLSARATGNVVVERAILGAIPIVKTRGLADGLEQGGVLTETTAAELRHGEATGTIGPTLKQIAKDARDQAARGTATLGTILSFALLAISAVYCVYSIFTKVMMVAFSSRHGAIGGGVPRPQLPWHMGR